MSSDHTPRTVHTVTADLTDSDLRAIAAEAGCPDVPVPQIRVFAAVSRVADSIFAEGVLSERQSLQRAREQLGVEPVAAH